MGGGKQRGREPGRWARRKRAVEAVQEIAVEQVLLHHAPGQVGEESQKCLAGGHLAGGVEQQSRGQHQQRQNGERGGETVCAFAQAAAAEAQIAGAFAMQQVREQQAGEDGDPQVGMARAPDPDVRHQEDEEAGRFQCCEFAQGGPQKKKCLVQSTSMWRPAEERTEEAFWKTLPYATPAMVARIM